MARTTATLGLANVTVKYNFFMTYDDFCALYVCFRDKRDDEIMQVTFQMCKLKPED